MRNAALAGYLLVLVYTVAITCGDAVVKSLSTSYAAPQVFVISGAVVTALCLLFNFVGEGTAGGLGTTCPRAMALRSLLTVFASLGYFFAFRLLPFAEVFLFFGITPVLAALMSATILHERPGATASVALFAGFGGILFLFPTGISSVSLGHVAALVASVTGALSIVLSRYIARHETNALAQVFYPNLAILIVMGLALPASWAPMAFGDALWVVVYGALLFFGRWLLVAALRLLPAYAVTSVIKIQFVWMVVIGAVFFGEWPTLNVYVGAAIVVGSGLLLVFGEKLPKPLAPVRHRPVTT
ncbi:MAG: DMT family transporter [Paracoccaceae bacterium]